MRTTRHRMKLSGWRLVFLSVFDATFDVLMVATVPQELRSAAQSASLSATSRGSPVKALPDWLVTYAYPTPTSGSAKPSDPPEPGAPNERALPNGQIGVDFMSRARTGCRRLSCIRHRTLGWNESRGPPRGQASPSSTPARVRQRRRRRVDLSEPRRPLLEKGDRATRLRITRVKYFEEAKVSD